MLLREETSYNIEELQREHALIHPKLNEEQQRVYNIIIKYVHDHAGDFFFLYGHGGTGKIFLYKAIITRLRSEKENCPSSHIFMLVVLILYICVC